MIVAGIVGALTNTVLVLGGIYLMYRTPDVAKAYNVNVDNLFKALMVIFTTNGVAEVVLAAVLVPIIGVPLRKVAIRGQKK